MAEYIEREAAIRHIKENKCSKCSDIGLCGNCAVLTAMKLFEAIPAADVVPVVRCEECRHWHRCLSDDGSVEYFNFSHCEKGHNGFPTFFCADGARMDMVTDCNQVKDGGGDV